MVFPKNFKIIHVTETSSTNDEVKSLEAGGGKEPFLVCRADFQTSGRGQRGNSWESEAAENLLFSILAHPLNLPANRQFVISEVVSLSLVYSLNRLHEGFRVKWPNDIYYGQSKVAGVLIENKLEKSLVQQTVAGVGLNVNQTIFRSDAPNPVSLHQILGHKVNREALLSRILEHFDSLWGLLESGREEELKERYFHNLFRSEGYHSYRSAEGIFEAAILGIEPDGHIVLAGRDGREHCFAFKEVRYVLDNRECE